MTDTEFIEAFRAYNENIFNFLCLRVHSREIAQDLTQEVYIKLWDNKAKYDPNKASIRTWLFKIARNHLIDHFRKNKNSFANISTESELLVEIYDDETTEKDLDIQYVLKKLYELEPEEQNLIILKYIEDLSNAEIAEIVDKNVVATKVAIHRAMKKLKRIINMSQSENEKILKYK